MKTPYSAIIPSPLGPLGLVIKDEKLLSLTMLADEETLIPPSDPYTAHIANELAAYFTDPKHPFDLSYCLKGTPFEKSVWQSLLAIPSGEPISYGLLAKELNTSPRAIGNACRKNPVPIIIPCHRVIGATHLGGYAGQQQGKMMTIKKWLLAHEGFQHLF